MSNPPDWYDESKLRRAFFVANEYSGWVVDLGDGTCRLANDPMIPGLEWGDRVYLIDRGEMPVIGDKVGEDQGFDIKRIEEARARLNRAEAITLEQLKAEYDANKGDS